MLPVKTIDTNFVKIQKVIPTLNNADSQGTVYSAQECLAL